MNTVTGSVRRIAILRALNLGDLLVAVPALHALRAGFPAAEITLIGLPWAREFVGRYAHLLDGFLPFPGYPGIPEVPMDEVRTAAFLRQQRSSGYDIAIQMHGSGGSSNPFVLALGARVSAGYFEGSDPGLDVAAHYPHHLSEVERNLGLAGLLGCRDRGLDLEFPLFPADHDEATWLLGLRDRRPLAVLHPGASAPSRRWPPERFAAVGDYLARERGMRVALTGGSGERDTARAVIAHMETPALDLAGRTSLGGLGAIIARAGLFVGNDTGPAHLADALGVPSVTIFGPAEYERWAPLDRQRHPVVRQPVACSPCPHTVCPIDHRCLRRIDPAHVIAKIDALLMKGAATCSA